MLKTQPQEPRNNNHQQKRLRQRQKSKILTMLRRMEMSRSCLQRSFHSFSIALAQFCPITTQLLALPRTLKSRLPRLRSPRSKKSNEWMWMSPLKRIRRGLTRSQSRPASRKPPELSLTGRMVINNHPSPRPPLVKQQQWIRVSKRCSPLSEERASAYTCPESKVC